MWLIILSTFYSCLSSFFLQNFKAIFPLVNIKNGRKRERNILFYPCSFNVIYINMKMTSPPAQSSLQAMLFFLVGFFTSDVC